MREIALFIWVSIATVMLCSFGVYGPPSCSFKPVRKGGGSGIRGTCTLSSITPNLYRLQEGIYHRAYKLFRHHSVQETGYQSKFAARLHGMPGSETEGQDGVWGDRGAELTSSSNSGAVYFRLSKIQISSLLSSTRVPQV